MKYYLYEHRKGVFVKGPEATGAGGAQGGLRPAVLICPGGGYEIIGTTEGAPVAARFAGEGYAPFVLSYSVGDFAAYGEKGFAVFGPVLDLAAAMRLLKTRAGEFGIDPTRIALAGFSAGGHLAAAYSLSESAAAVVPPDLLPAALMLVYAMGGGADTSGAGKAAGYEIAAMPFRADIRGARSGAGKRLPVFLTHARDDTMVPFVCSERLDERLAREGISHEFFALDHGVVHANPFEAGDAWFARMINWLGENL